MRIFIIIAILGLIAYGVMNYSKFMGGGGGTNPAGITADIESFEGVAVEPYALPAGHCKAQFPGKAHPPDLGHAILASSEYQCESAVLSDKKVSYFLSELKAPYMEDKAATQAEPGVPQDDSKATAALEKTIEYWAKANDVTIKDRRHIGHSSGKYSGLEVKGYIKDPANSIIARFFCDYPNQRVYAVAAAGDVAATETEKCGPFLDSIEIW